MTDTPQKIAIIDDNTDYLFIMETFFSRNGYETVTAPDGNQGMDLIKAEKPDLIILDIMMETTFSGFEVCRQIRSDAALKKIPIIGVSGMADEIGVKFNKTDDAEYFSPDVFFDKPVDKDALLLTIGNLLS